MDLVCSSVLEHAAIYTAEDCKAWPSEALLARVLRSGAAAHALVSVFGSVTSVADATVADLTRVPGVSDARARQVLAAIELGRRAGFPPVYDRTVRTPADIVSLVAMSLSGLKREVFLILLLNTRHKLLKAETISIGSLAAAIVHPREVFRPAVLAAASAIALAHNHPSGDPEPSAEDLEITTRLRDAGRLIGIEVLDHVILGENRSFVSLRERGLL